MAFQDWQCRLDGLDFGTGTPYRIYEFTAEKPEVRTQDTDMPAADGIRMGRDFLSGTLVAVSLGIAAESPDLVMDRLAALRHVWDGDRARYKPGAVMELEYQRPGSEPRVVFGRPRRFSPATMGNVASGYVPVECDFQAVDSVFYSRQVHSLTIGGIALEYQQGTGGVIPPLVAPVTLAEVVVASTTVTNAGTKPAWPIYTLHGPRHRPGVRYNALGIDLELAYTLNYDEWVTVDTRPWRRSVVSFTGASLAGRLRGPRLSEVAFPPGDTELAFLGADDTGNSYMTVEWRDAYSSP